MKPNKLKSQPVLASGLVLTILILGFLSVFVDFSKVQAAPAVNNPNLVQIGSTKIPLTGTCTNPCGSPINGGVGLFGLIQVGNGFNPALFNGDGMVLVERCTQAIINAAPTDTLGDTWLFAVALVQLGLSNTNGNGNNFAGYIYYTNIVTTASTSFHIAQTTAVNTGNCWFELYLMNTGVVKHNVSGAASFFFTSVNGLTTKYTPLAFTTGGNIVTTVPNTMVFLSTWVNSTVADSPQVLGGNNLGQVYLNNPGIGAGTTLLQTSTFFGYFNAQTTQSFLASWIDPNSPTNTWYGIYVLVVYLVPTGNQASGCNGLSCSTIGGGTTISKTTFSPTANTTYYYVSNSGNGGISITNVTSKVQSYVNAVLGKTNDTVQISLYLSSCSVNGEPETASVNCPYINFGGFSATFYVTNGVTNQWLHALKNTTITIPPNSLYVWSIISKFSGLTLYTASNAQPMFNTTEGLFTSTTWKPPTQITLQRPNIKSGVIQDLFLEWFGTQNVSTQTITSTSTSITTITSGQTAVTATSTAIQTVTTQIYSRSSGATSQNDLQDLETFFPIWIFPILFSPFGIQGVLTGFMMGIVLGALLGIIPLWAAFLMSIGVLYVMIRRG